MDLLLHLTIPTTLVLIATGSGWLLVSNTRLRFASRAEGLIFSTAVGFGLLAYSIFTLAALHLLYPAAVIMVIGLWLVMAIWGWISVKKWQCDDNRQTPVNELKRPLKSDRVIRLFLGLGIVACLGLVLSPPVANDSLSYHLEAPNQYLRHHGFFFISGNIFSNYPLFTEMLYIVGLTLGSGPTAKAIHFIFALLVLWSMVLFGKAHLKLDQFSTTALLIFFSIPSVFLTSSKAYSDLSITFFTLMAIYAFLNFHTRKDSIWLSLSGCFSGMAMATKYGGLLLPLLGILAVLWSCRAHHNGVSAALRFLLIYTICAAVVGCPFYIKNWIISGNPLYPYFYKIFGGLDWDMIQARRYDLFHRSLGMGRGLMDYLALPWNLSFQAKINSPQFDGIIGPLFILLFPFALGVKKWPVGAKFVLVYCGFSFLFWALTVQQIRYLIPVLAFLSLIGAMTIQQYGPASRIFPIVAIILVLGIGFNGYQVAKIWYRVNPVAVVLGLESKSEYYHRMIPAYPIYDHINQHLPNDSKVFMIYLKNLGFLCKRPYYSDSIFESHTIEKMLNDSKDSRALFKKMKKNGFTHLAYDSMFVFGTLSTFSQQNRQRFLEFHSTHLKPVFNHQNRFHLFQIDQQKP